MSSERGRGVLNTLKNKFSELNISRVDQECHRSSNLEKTAADYIHENEMRLRSYSMPSQNILVKPIHLKHAETNVATYVFEKVKHKTIRQSVKYDMCAVNSNVNESLSEEYILDCLPSEIRPRTSSMPNQNTCHKPTKRTLQRSQLNLNIVSVSTDKPPYLKDKTSKWDQPKTFENLYLGMFFEDEMRTRTSSMPTRSVFSKPRIHHLRRSHQDLFTKQETEMHGVRSFQLNTKGKIVKRSESRSRRSSNSEHSLEDDSQLVCKNLSRKSSVTRTHDFQVFVKGLTGVGKTALMQQFLTAQYLGGFNTSYDGETEKTVNVLLNGEETALAFVEGTEHEDDASDTVAAYMTVYACDDRASFDRAVDMLYNLRQKEMRKNVIFLVGNKSDLVRSRCITTEEISERECSVKEPQLITIDMLYS